MARDYYVNKAFVIQNLKPVNIIDGRKVYSLPIQVMNTTKTASTIQMRITRIDSVSSESKSDNVTVYPGSNNFLKGPYKGPVGRVVKIDIELMGRYGSPKYDIWHMELNTKEAYQRRC